MHMRTLGNSKLTLSELALGTWGLADGPYGAVDRATFEATVEAALEVGVTAFDMAPLWGDGLSEEIVGRVVGDRRDSATFITRVGHERVDGELRERFGADEVRASCEASLERLGTDRIDLLLLHDPPHWVLEPDHTGWAKTLASLQAEGLVRAWGASVATADQAREAMGYGAQALCLPYNLLNPYLLDELAEEIEEAGVGVVVRSPLLHGLLADAEKGPFRFEEGDHRRQRWDFEALAQRVEHVDHLRYLVHDHVQTLASAALRFVLRTSLVGTVAVGAHTPQQIRDAAQSIRQGPYLPEVDAERIRQVLAAVGA